MNISIIDQDQSYRKKLEDIISLQSDIFCLYSTNSIKNFNKDFKSIDNLNILLINIDSFSQNISNTINKLKQSVNSLEIVALTNQSNSSSILPAICSGAGHILYKKEVATEAIPKILQKIHLGETIISPNAAHLLVRYFHPNQIVSNDFTKREHQVIQFIIDGLSYKHIASILGITLDGVRFHIRKIYKKLNVNSKAQLVKKYLNGQINLDNSAINNPHLINPMEAKGEGKRRSDSDEDGKDIYHLGG